MIHSPCYICEERKVGCHSGCENYKAYLEKIRAVGSKIRSDTEAVRFLIVEQTKTKAVEAKKKQCSRYRRHKRR